MRCKRCGGMIDAVAGECIQCSMRLPDEHRPIIRSMEELAREYCLPEEEETTVLPELFRDYEDKKTKLAQALQTSVDDKNTSPIKGNPVLGLDEYARLLGVDGTDQIAAVSDVRTEELSEDRNLPFVQDEDEKRELHPVLQKIDNIIEKPADKVLKIIHEKYPQPARVRKSPAIERLMLLAGTFCAVLVVLLLTVLIAVSIAPDISGEWLVAETTSGERLTIEFTNSGEVVARAYINGEENIYMTGDYKVRRSNGSNLLTITYDDGSEKRLYYTIESDSGTFTNVDSNKSDTYTRID